MTTWRCNPPCPEALKGASGGETSYVRSPSAQPTGAEAAPATNLRSRSRALRRRIRSSRSKPHRRRHATETKNHRGRSPYVLANDNLRARILLRNRTLSFHSGHVGLLRQRRALRCRSHRLRDSRSHHQAPNVNAARPSSNESLRTHPEGNDSEDHFEIEGSTAQYLTCDDNGNEAMTSTTPSFVHEAELLLAQWSSRRFTEG